MRIDANGNIVLSRRNLLSLLSKLEENKAGGSSAVQIVKRTDEGFISIRAEEDSTHYKLTSLTDPGPMTPQTEGFISKIEKVLSSKRTEDFGNNSWKD